MFDGVNRSCKDANEVLYQYGKDKVLELIDNAQEMPFTGAVDLSKVDEFDIETAPGLYTGLSGLDDIVYKFLFGNVVVVTGQRGSGKSTLLNQIFICEPLHQGHDIMVFSGELAPPILKSWMELTMAGPEHSRMKDGSRFVHIVEKESKTAMRDWYENRVWVYNKKENSAQEILDTAVATIRKYGVKVVILDNLSTMDLGANDNNLNEKQKWLMVELVRLAALYNVLFVLVAHPRKTASGMELNSDDVGGSGALTNLAQYVISVKRFGKREKNGVKDNKGGYKPGMEPIDEDVEVNIMKNRMTGRIDAARFYFHYESYRFWKKTTELYKRYKWDKSVMPLPTKNPRENNPFGD
jgi:twinkle protein